MATYSELLLASENEILRNKGKVACVIAAEAIRTEAGTVTNNANRRIWARQVLKNPDGDVTPMVWAVLAQNASATLAAIVGASDTQVQSAVNAAVDVLAQGNSASPV